MGNDDWRARLQKAIDDSGMSYRAVSLAANKGPGYIHSILNEGKYPSVVNLIAVCDIGGGRDRPSHFPSREGWKISGN